MEDTIVNLNNQIQTLHEELDAGKLSVAILQNELSKSRTSMQELQDELVCNSTTIHELKEEIENKNTNIIELTEELSQKNILLEEVGELKINLNESVKRIVFLEKSLKEKSEALEKNIQLLNNVKIELDQELEAAFIREQEFVKEEQELRAKYDNEIRNIKQQYSDQLKNVLDNNCLKEKFLEKQIEMLFNRIEELTERGQSHQQEYETVKRMYEEEYNEMKSKVDEISKSSGSHIQDLNNRLAASLSNEVAFKVELKSRIDNEKKTKQEVINIKNKLEESLINEKKLCQRLQEAEMQLDSMNEEKEALRKQCLNANNLYDQLNDNYDRERNEILQEQKRVIDSYENDMSNLIKVLKDLHHHIDNIYFNFMEDLSNSESNESLITLPFISKEAFSNTCFYGAMKIVCDSMSESIKLRKEFKNLVEDSQHLRVAFEARKRTCEENAQQMAALQNEIMTLEKEKDFAVSNLRYFEQQNEHLKYEKVKSNDEIAMLNDEIIRYKKEYDKLNQQCNEEVYAQFADPDLSPIRPDYKEAIEGEFINPLHIQPRAPPHSANALIQLAASTPCQRNICDPEGGGEFVKYKPFKSKTELHSSLVKWMEKCHELDRKNKSLNANVEGLSLEVHNLKLSSQLLKEEMNAYEEARSNLEQKLSNYGSLRQRFTELQDENEKLANEVRSSVKELDYIRNENQQLSEKNVQIEEKYNKYIGELTERKTSENNTITNEALINNFNEKLQEIVRLKGEINSLRDAKRYLIHRVDLLLEANDSYSAKIDETYDELNLCKNDLETMRNEKMDLCSSNRILNKEVQLLQLRVDYLTSLRDIHRSSAGSLGETEDLFQELILFARSIMDNKVEGNGSSEMSDDEKADQVSIQEILKTLNHQLNEEKLDFDGKLIELQDIINISKKGDVPTDDWILQLDKKLRTIIEEMKFHKEQYNRIEEALRSTGKFHDELQKQKDQLRVKDHEISSLEKRITEEKMQIKKLACHVKYLQHELEDKNEIIAITFEQKITLEKELKEFQYKLCDVEKKYEIEIKAADWKLQQAKIFNLENEVERKFILTQKDEKWLEGDPSSENWQKVRDEVEKIYQNALQQVQYFFNAEVSSSVAQVQEDHKEQIAEFQRIIDEQAIKIGILMKKNMLEDGLNNDAVFINEEYKKQFDLATYALQQLHQEEIQLLKLQLGAEKHYEIYRNIYENQQNINKESGICLKSAISNSIERNLSKKLESALLEDFISRLKNFVSDWHSLYTKEIITIKNKLQSGIDEGLNENLTVENLKKIDNENHEFLNQYNSIVNSAKEFLRSLETERDHIIENLNNFVEIYNDKTVELFEQINLKHCEKAEILSIQEELTQTRKEKEELEKMHKNAIELLNADHKSEQTKIQNILTEIKQCFESGCDPNALIKLRNDLEERHRKELEDLRTYFEDKCTHLGKQYSEDVNSLHSRMLSLSSSCSDEIMSDHLGFERGGAGDNNLIFSEMETENISTLDKLTTDQYKLIEELNFKWSENVKEMKKELEKKYSKKIEQLQDKLSTFVYNNELDITVRCIKEDVMRDCKIEIDDIKKEISARMIASGEYADDYNDLFKNHDEQLVAAFGERDAAWEQIVEVMGHSLSQEAINKITIEIIWDTLKKCDIREKIVSNVSDLLTSMEEKLSTITVKLKDKESKLVNLQNNMNICSQLYSDTLCKLKNHNEIVINSQLLENPQLLEKIFEEDSEEISIPPEIIKIKNILKNMYDKKLSKEKEKLSTELESIRTSYDEKEKKIHSHNSQLMEKLMRGDFEEQDWPPEIIQIKNILQEVFEKKLVEEREKNTLALQNLKQLNKDEKCEKNNLFSENSDLNEIIQERDHLKEMTVTLKTAVGQLISYLNTCEDELNKTVVEELLKVYLDTPKKANPSTYESLECTPELKKVHFAPDVGICGDLDSSHDISAFLQLQLDSCLSKLKVEAASLLGLSALQPPPANLNKQIENLRKENEELLQEVADLKLRLYKHQNDSLELRDQFSEETQSENSFTYLQDKAQQLLNGAQNNPQDLAKTLEDLAKLGDNLIHELQKEKADLQLQIEAADKQLKSTRQFLEDQAVERETERDDYSKEILNLQVQLKEKGKNISSHERFTTQVEELEQQLKESNVLLEECEKKKCLVEAELKDAIDKVWVLRDIISDLETQLSNKSEKEALLEQKLDELETELDQQNGTQYAMVQELESLRSQSLDEGYLEQIKQLEENIKVQFNSTVVRQLKSQLQDLEKTLAHRTKELETVYLNNSSNSLSSPSEEVSVREQLEWSRSRTPEQCPSPVSLPVDEVSRLQDKIVRHFRAEEMLIKRLRDQQLITVKLQVELEEMHAERDVLQKHKKKQMVLLAEANNKIDDLRHKVETAQTAANKDLISQIQELKEKYSKAEQALESTHNQLIEHKIQLAHAEEILTKQKIEIRNLAHCDHEIVDSLRLELAAVTTERNKLEDLLDKYRRDYNLDVVNALLVDKNEDIDHLQHTVAMLQSQKEGDENHGSRNSKGHRVSFATDVENSNSLGDDMRLRDAPNMQSLNLYTENTFQVFGGPISPIPRENEKQSLSTSLKSFSLSDQSILDRTDNETEDKLELVNLRQELQDKNDRIISLEKEIEYLKSIEKDLKNAETELQALVSSVTEDKKYYENELHFMSEKLSKQDEDVKKLKNSVKLKNEELLKTTADVQALREISLNLQEKLKEAKQLAEKDNVHLLKEDLAHLNEELLSREKEIAELEQELQLFKSDYNDEKELCDALKSSLNAISTEKQDLEENISLLTQKNNDLLNSLQVTEDRLNQYITAVRNLKNDLSSKTNTLEAKHISSNAKASFIENDMLTLQEEIVKLINLNENLFQERNNVLEELNELKMTINCEDSSPKDSLIGQLQEELNELRKAVHSVKEEKLATFANFSKEICQLHKDIDNIQDSKQEVVQKWKQELLEKQSLKEQCESLRTELESEKCHNKQERLSNTKKQRLSLNRSGTLDIPPVLPQSKLEKLTFCRSGVVDIQPVSNKLPQSKVQRLSFTGAGSIDIQPVSHFPVGMDALADKMRKEIKLSATLDNSLLESILPESSDELQGTSETSEGVSSHFVTITSKLRSLEKALLSEMEKARESRNSLRQKEAQYRQTEAEKNEMKLRLERLGRMLAAHDEKITVLSNQLKMEKDKVITLELMVSKEQASLKKVSSLLEEERSRARESQKEDIALIETMRKRLQNLMENETILKQMVRDERQKCNSLTAQLNSLRAIEQYRSDSEGDSHKNCQKILSQERDRYLQIKVECEKERRTCEDLREVLTRERTAILYLQDSLTKSEKNRHQIEKEVNVLKQQLSEELVRRELADRMMTEGQRIEGSKFQQQLETIELRNKKSLEAAYAVIKELEQEYNDLKVYIRSQQEHDDRWKDQVHLPLIQQLNEVNDNLDALIKERVELKRTIDKHNEENNRLHTLINDLKKMIPASGRLSVACSSLEVPNVRLQGGAEVPLIQSMASGRLSAASSTSEVSNVRLQGGTEVVAPFIQREVDCLLDRVLLSERHKKALVFQKRYLLVALRGYQDAHTETLYRLQRHRPHRERSRKLSFRSVVLAVIATLKITKLPLKRMSTYHKRRGMLLSNLKRSLSRSTAEMERLTSIPTSRQIAPHSPPSRDRATLRLR